MPRLGVSAGIAVVAFGLGPTAGQALPAFAIGDIPSDRSGTATSGSPDGTEPTGAAAIGGTTTSTSAGDVAGRFFGRAGPVAFAGVPGGDGLDGVIPGVGSPSESVAAGTSGATTSSTDIRSGDIPARALAAYTRAATRMATIDPGCQISWSLLAGIGSVESSHGRAHGSVLDAAGVETPAVYGVRLDGSTPDTGVVRDGDDGRLDGDAVYDRAVGPMQFLPSTWRAYALDADGDHVANPQDVDDAALSAARYLCAGRASGTSLATVTGQWQAAYRYNHATSYADLVVALATGYAGGTAVLTPPPATTPAATTPVTTTPAETTRTPTATATSSPTPSSPPVPTATASPTSPAVPTTTVTVTPSSSSPSSSSPSSSSPSSSSPSSSPPSSSSPSCSPSSSGSVPSTSGTATPSATATPASSPC